MNINNGVPEFVRVGPATKCPDPITLPQIQPIYLISIQIALADAIQAPPPTRYPTLVSIHQCALMIQAPGST